MRYSDINLNRKTILITGGAGFIGSNLAFYFQENYPDVHIVILDLFRSNLTLSNGNLKSFGHFKNLLGFRGEVISGDINDKGLLNTLTQMYKFDYIFHEAAISDTTALEQDLMVQTNVNAFKDLLDIAVAHGANMIYASSGATYGDAPSPQRVGCEAPQNVYGFSKLMMDHLARQYSQKFENISIVGLRYFNVYGPREFFKNKTSSMVVQFAHQLLAGKNPKLFENSDKILRDFIYIEDIIQANILAMHPKENGVFNVGTGKARSFQSMVDILQNELGTSFACEYIPNPYIGRYQFHTEADIESTKAILGYQPRFEFEEGISAYVPEIKRLYEQELS
ncbi:ADP-glyceromanno-heptose 6-epimerase [Sulfuricurvum sp. RIFCSPLOWO2_12_FULL_43_24]|uniref:ADP-glyceromanno-heptose 6-epimerase n=1 Tax=Sulfuricurvum sp. RIFCSPLOWO2_12_FULL_43_24 TaxID=1802247 RepID=UPI0008C82076|nr:ADP-glyceromanno-heptose 6-epimerase [Sulfuricurvum sp. RIFCSPLOWO2_12_FULL_43_24]OHD80902.1 MAG: ADP-glyceromanno-heptose 6-epimerase [Sulfuricurvum sp. RIFCSPHIGHO2_02_FULL_43_9]OHD83348.1 MAG: ADP-glyceromanno-heptose 6-epimerase [Sulfuricurvum sp. RIFCSPHIGHO2_12_FULL_44_8]OHD88618.1 MAG: ADP-glyceromanno-heptose 6-epimerase [Sulfuricurvum sp. RIFCSPLOWO2_12_FULL_43_24]